ncbi:MAG: ATP synthase F1 subunit delta [Crocinitomicaceae bacterium]
MASSRVASRYAKALLDLSIEQNSLDKVNADMLNLASLCRESKDLSNLLKSPIIDKNKKVDAFNAVFGKDMDKMSLGFFQLIVKNSRADIVAEIAESFVALYKEHNGMLDVYLTSAVPLEAKTKDQIVAKIQQNFDGKITLHESIDDTLIGGFVVKINDKQIDASIASQLSNLKNILLN